MITDHGVCGVFETGRYFVYTVLTAELKLER